MDLLIIRHGPAEDRDEFAKTGKSDDLRPLTAEGRVKTEHAADGLREVAPEISVLATSPLTRAQQTAEIVAEVYGIEIHATTEALRPTSSFDDFIDWLGDRAKQDVVAVVGHDPHLSGLATWLIAGNDKPRIHLKKAGACLIAFDGAPKKGSGELQWLLQPAQLRAIGHGK